MAELKKVCNEAIEIIDDNNHTWLSKFKSMECRVWLVTGMAVLTASYDVFCIFLVVRLMGRRYFTDDPLLLQRVVQPGRMPIGMEGILLSICLIGAFFGNLFFGALGDNFGRKAMLEVALSIMIIGSFFSAFSFSGIQATATGNNVVGSLCFWRVILGFGVGGIFPLTATIMAEYSSKYTRGGYVSLVFAMQAIGLLLACAVAGVAAGGITQNFPSGEFPVKVLATKYMAACDSFLVQDANGGPCPVVNQVAYARAVSYSNPSESEYIWRAVVSAGALPGLITLLLSVFLLVETPRYTTHIAEDYQKTITDLASQGVDHTEDALAAVFRDAEMMYQEKEVKEPYMSICGFLYHYSWHLFACSCCYSVVNFVFFGQLLQVNQVLKYVGYNKQQEFQSTLDESMGYVKGFVLVVLVPLVPGYYFAAFTIDSLGHRVLQWLGFVLTAAFLAACAGSHDFLLNPNYANDNGGIRSYWTTSKGGWLLMYALTFFFMSWGPLTSIYVITCELFPTKWRATGYGICNACGNISGVIGIFIFLFAQQPRQKETTKSYPCNRAGFPSDYNSFGACATVNNCPHGRLPEADVIGAECSVCPFGVNSGCYPYGIGLKGTLAVMIPFLFFGALMTQLLPITTYGSLSEVDYKVAIAEEEETEPLKKEKFDSESGFGVTVVEGTPQREQREINN